MSVSLQFINGKLKSKSQSCSYRSNIKMLTKYQFTKARQLNRSVLTLASMKSWPLSLREIHWKELN